MERIDISDDPRWTAMVEAADGPESGAFLAADRAFHAEVLALRRGARALAEAGEADGWRLSDCTLVVTLEPCPMCAGALLLARIPRVVFGAWDPKAGACGSVLDVVRDPRFNHAVQVRAGVRNLTDKTYKVEGQEFASVGNIQTAYYGWPRNWYVSVRYNF